MYIVHDICQYIVFRIACSWHYRFDVSRLSYSNVESLNISLAPKMRDWRILNIPRYPQEFSSGH